MSQDLPKYWRELAYDMNAMGAFCHKRVQQALLRQAHYARRAEVRPATTKCVPSEPIWGYVSRLKTIDSHWQELANFYVREDKSGNGVLSDMVNALLAGVPKGIRLFGITKSPAVTKVFVRHGLFAITKAVMPNVEEWASQIGIENRLPETALQTGQPCSEVGERWLFAQRD